jgi:hypothetical protein
MVRSDPKRYYTSNEAHAILERALDVEAGTGIGHDELVAAAAEVGVSREAIERAVVEIEAAEAERQARTAILRRRRRGLTNHLVPFLAVNAFFFIINWLWTPHWWWATFPLMFWGLGLFFHAWAALSRQVSPKALRRELRRAEGQAADRRPRAENKHRHRLRHEQLEQGARQLGDAVEEGVANLLHRLAAELRQGAQSNSGVRVESPEQQNTATAGSDWQASQRETKREQR